MDCHIGVVISGRSLADFVPAISFGTLVVELDDYFAEETENKNTFYGSDTLLINLIFIRPTD